MSSDFLIAFAKAPETKAVQKMLSEKSAVHAEGLWGASLGLAVAALAKARNRPALLVVPNEKEAEDYVDDVAVFTNAHVYRLPGLGGHQAQRSQVIEKILGGGLGPNDLVVASGEALLDGIPSKADIEKLSFHFKLGQEISEENLRDFLSKTSWEAVPRVEGPGQFSLRGGIADIYPPSAKAPYRLDFFGDTLDRLTVFDPASQRTVETLEEVALSFASYETGPHLVFDYLTQDVDFYIAEPHALQEHIETAGGPVPVKEGRENYHRLVDFWKPYTRTYLHHLPAGGQGAVRFNVQSLQSFEGALGEKMQTLLNLESQCRSLEVFLLNDAEQKRFAELQQESGLAFSKIKEHTGRLRTGFVFQDQAFVGYHEILGRPLRHRVLEAGTQAKALESFLELKEGDLVVHVQHGIARFLGTEILEKQGGEEEFLVLVFADSARLYVPVNQMALVQKYIGSGERRPNLSTLGGKRWAKAKAQVQAAAKDLAAGLLRTQALRESLPGFVATGDRELMLEFEGAFPYQETSDQLLVWDELKKDLEQTKPMDRLICGDVGYGKTELAMRAAFKMVTSGKQVAVLVPTTVLAMQHGRNFKERFAEFPVSVHTLSRFVPPKKQKDILEAAALGQADIVIGTHRLLSEDVYFPNLGLVIIDEEQRFGVEHKERLKHFSATVDVLTLTATPIPRTLHMSMVGLRDISNLSTPPVGRQSIHTILQRTDPAAIAQAIRFELHRGGQVYFLHNRVQSIEATAEKLKALIPEAKFLIGHGQMNEHELEEVMAKFVEGQADVLVATTIIESGLDIPNVNTIIINDAHRFGLAQLHQLRGRVGRFKHKAFAYLLLPERGSLPALATKRLKAIEEYSELGAGFAISMRDLEIRGAGNLLGPEQSGHIALVGYELFCQILSRTVAELKREPFEEPPQISLELGFTAHIPEDYAGSAAQKLTLYRTLGKCTKEDQVDEFTGALTDRFGPLPQAVQMLLDTKKLILRLAPFGINRLRLREEGVEIFAADFSEVLTLKGRGAYQMRQLVEGTWLLVPAKPLGAKKLLAFLLDLVDPSKKKRRAKVARR